MAHSPLFSTDDGFCDYDFMPTNTRGNFSWNETRAGTTLTQPCVFGLGTVNTARFCDPVEMDWQPSNASLCPTFVTERIQNLGDVSCCLKNVFL